MSFSPMSLASRTGPTQNIPGYNSYTPPMARATGPPPGPVDPMTQATMGTQPIVGGPGDSSTGVPGPQAPQDAALASTIGNIATGLMGMAAPSPAGLVSTIGGLVNALAPGQLSGLVSVNGLSTNSVASDTKGIANNSVPAVGPTTLMGLALGMPGQQAATGGGLATSPGVAAQGSAAAGIAEAMGNAGGPGGSAAGDASGSASAGAGAAFKKGGKVKAPLGKPVQATVHGGEYILNAKTAMEYGTKYLDKLNKQKIKRK